MSVQRLKRGLLAGLSACIVLGGAPGADAAIIAGQARVVDGDTLVINGERIRLYGVDAPESAQQCQNESGREYACGLASKDALARKIGTLPVKCEVKQQDQYGRNVSVCTIPSMVGSEDINRWLVENGLAVAYRQYGKDYIGAEDAAHAARKGIWAGQFQMPNEWRKQNKRGESGPVQPSVPFTPPAAMLPSSAAMAPAAGGSGSGPQAVGGAPTPTCPGGSPAIKGNIGKGGDKIYHVPGGRYYDAVRIDLPDGERFFCSEAEAAAAGWRKSAQ